MKQATRITAAIAAIVAATASMGVLAQTPASTPAQSQKQTQPLIYGSRLMTAQERNEYRQRMRELKTQQERDEFRKEHHAKMQERAKERGLSLPADPPARGMGPGPRGSGPGRL